MSRNTHHRQRDHEGVDLAEKVVLGTATTTYGEGTSLQTVVDSLDDRVGINTELGGFTYMIGNGMTTITSGIKGWVQMPFDGIFTYWSLTADQSGEIEIDLWKRDFGNYPPLVGDSICNSVYPLLHLTDSNSGDYWGTMDTWDKDFLQNDIIYFYVRPVVADVTRVALSMQYTRDTTFTGI